MNTQTTDTRTDDRAAERQREKERNDNIKSELKKNPKDLAAEMNRRLEMANGLLTDEERERMRELNEAAIEERNKVKKYERGTVLGGVTAVIGSPMGGLKMAYSSEKYYDYRNKYADNYDERERLLRQAEERSKRADELGKNVRQPDKNYENERSF